MMNFASPYLLVLSVLLPLSSFAAPADDFLEVRAFIEAQVQKHDSELNDSLRLFSTSAKLPVESHFNLYGANLMVTGPQQTYHDCANNNCKYYERNFFKQYAEFRYENYTPYGSTIQIWRVALLVQVFRVWKSDPQASHLQIIKNETSIPSIYFE